MTDNLRCGPLPKALSKEVAELVATSCASSSREYKFLCLNDSARATLTKTVYTQLIAANHDPSSMFVLFDSRQYGDIASIVGFVEIIAPDGKWLLRDCLSSCMDCLLLAPLHLDDGLWFVWRCVKLASVLHFALHDVLSAHIGEYWLFVHCAVKGELRGRGHGARLLALAQQKCAMHSENEEAPVVVLASTA